MNIVNVRVLVVTDTFYPQKPAVLMHFVEELDGERDFVLQTPLHVGENFCSPRLCPGAVAKAFFRERRDDVLKNLGVRDFFLLPKAHALDFKGYVSNE